MIAPRHASSRPAPQHRIPATRIGRRRHHNPPLRAAAPADEGAGAPGPSSTLSALDSLLSLGSQDTPLSEARPASNAAGATGAASAAASPPALREPPLSLTDLGALQEPRVRPDISTSMYYLVLVVYASIYATELLAGPDAADALRANLSNDHVAVAAGDALRLFTASFVTSSVRQLGAALLCLFTVGSELEALMGPGPYWALLCLSVVAGGFADALLSPLPITAGPAPLIAGLVAALLAFHVKNWQVEAQLQQVREARAAAVTPGGGLMAPSVARQRLKAMLFDLAGGPPPRLLPDAGSPGGAEGSNGEGSSGSNSSGGGSGGGKGGGPELEQTKIELLEGLWAPTLLLPKEAKAFATLGGLAAASVSAVVDAAGLAGGPYGAAGSYPGTVAAFVFGGLLGYAVSPRWRVAFELADREDEQGAGGGGGRRPAASVGGQLFGPGGLFGGGAGGGGPGASVSGSLDSGGAVYWRPRLSDAVTGKGRANAIVGAAGVLYAALGVWLLLY